MSTIHDVTAMTWERFRELFYGKYFTDAMRASRRVEFANLKQDEMSVAEYIRKFDELSRYAPHMVATNELKVDQFMQGLRKTIVRDLKSGGIRGVPFAQIADRALDAEQAERDVLDEEKIRRERQAREMQRGFRPGFQANRGEQTQFQRPQDMKRRGVPTQQPRPDQGKRPRIDQGTPTAGLLQCKLCGKNHIGECRRAARLCFICGKSGHFIKDCPKAASDQKKPGGRLYAMTGTETDTGLETEADPSIITGEILISGIIAHALIDSGSTHSHASLTFVRRLGRPIDQMSTPFGATLPSGEVMYSDNILKACSVMVVDRELFADLIVLDMNDYEIILGLDWLSKYFAKIDCKKKMVIFHPKLHFYSVASYK